MMKEQHQKSELSKVKLKIFADRSTKQGPWSCNRQVATSTSCPDTQTHISSLNQEKKKEALHIQQMQQISMAATSLSLPRHSLVSSLLSFQSSTKPSSSFSQILFKSSQFYGLKLSHPSSLSCPSTTFSTKTSIFAKVHSLFVHHWSK